MESPKSHASEVVGSTPPAHSASSPTVHRQPRPDRQEESERLRGVVKRLKGERSALHTQLQEREYVRCPAQLVPGPLRERSCSRDLRSCWT